MSIDTTQATGEADTNFTLTYEEFDRMVERGAFDDLGRKVELIRGELKQMNPAGPLHDGLIIYLNSWSGRVINHDDLLVTSQTGLNLRELESRPEPDLMWVRNARYLREHPSARDVRLAIEVSYSSLKIDLNQKADLYAEAGIVEYWIIDATASCVHVFREPQGTGYTKRQIANRGEMLSPQCLPGAQLDVADLFAE